MEAGFVIDLVREACWMALLIGSPLLLIGMVIGLIISLLQALTQIQDQTLNAVPKIIAMVIALIVCLPWLTDRMIEYSRTAISEIPEMIHR